VARQSACDLAHICAITPIETTLATGAFNNGTACRVPERVGFAWQLTVTSLVGFLHPDGGIRWLERRRTFDAEALLADIVAKVENRRAIIFPPKDDVTGNRRSLYSQSRYQGRQ
jgi:hypothetical protein